MKTDDILVMVILLLIIGLALGISNDDIYNSLIYFVTSVTVAIIYATWKKRK